MPAPMISATASPAFSTSSKLASSTLRALRLGQQLHRDFDDDAEHAFRSGKEREQVEARGVERFGTERQTLAVDRQDLDLQDVVHGQAVFQAMHAARVLRHVAADRAGDLRRRIGRVVEAVRRGGLRDREIAHAGLHARVRASGSMSRMRLKRAITSRMPFSSGSAPPDRPVPAPRATTGTLRAVANFSSACTCSTRVGQRDHHRRRAIRREAVALERTKVFSCVQKLQVGQQRAEFRDERGLVVGGERAVERARRIESSS